ncbi:TspO/MBR family protein [Solicola sp. PLA-1-18]|uniref:TspO/MBR family protein n=1 Tax=Solicola sp. PLA-1-18 TaxID=3380532 RepID=UPI003B7D7297
MFAKRLAATATAVTATAVVGGLAGSGADDPWFRRLRKPAFQPPGAAFPVVWTALYADIAVSTAATLEQMHRPRERAAYQRALALNLVLNAGWTWTFFKARQLPAAVVAAGALAASSADLARRSRDASPRAAVALVPYAGWCGFATFLSATLWRLNR